MGRAFDFSVPVLVFAFASMVGLLVLAKRLINLHKGSKVYGQYDCQLWKYVFMVLHFVVLRSDFSGRFFLFLVKMLLGRRRRKSRNKWKRYLLQFRVLNTSCEILGNQVLMLVTPLILGIVCGIIGISHATEYSNSGDAIFGNKICLVSKDRYLGYSNISSPCFQQNIRFFRPNKTFSSSKLFFIINSTSTKVFSSIHSIIIDSNSKVTDSSSEVSKITEQLEDTILDCSGIIIHPSNDSSDAEEEFKECELIGNFIIESRMKFKMVEMSWKFAWDFLSTEEDVRVYEMDQNYMIFNFGNNSELKDYVYSTRPWSIDGTLVILHPYDPSVAYTELDWNHQPVWIEVCDLLPEHMNQKTITEMGKLMGEVIHIEPKTGLPRSGDYFKVCVNINISTPLRRGLLCMTAAKTTKWIGFFYEKQPSKICKECYILKHSKEDCKKDAASLDVLHGQVHYFTSMRGAKKNLNPSSVKVIPTMKSQPKKAVSTTRFVPLKDGIVMQSLSQKVITENQGGIESDSGVVLGKRHRSAEHGTNTTGSIVTVNSFVGSPNPLGPFTVKVMPAGTTQRLTHEEIGGDKFTVNNTSRNHVQEKGKDSATATLKI